MPFDKLRMSGTLLSPQPGFAGTTVEGPVVGGYQRQQVERAVGVASDYVQEPVATVVDEPQPGEQGVGAAYRVQRERLRGVGEVEARQVEQEAVEQDYVDSVAAGEAVGPGCLRILSPRPPRSAVGLGRPIASLMRMFSRSGAETRATKDGLQPPTP